MHVFHLLWPRFLQQGSGAAEEAEALALSLNTHRTLDLGLKLLLFSAVTFGEKRAHKKETGRN